jgi:hypothetical protein
LIKGIGARRVKEVIGVEEKARRYNVKILFTVHCSRFTVHYIKGVING